MNPRDLDLEYRDLGQRVGIGQFIGTRLCIVGTRAETIPYIMKVIQGRLPMQQLY
jgi:hypothetical protein